MEWRKHGIWSWRRSKDKFLLDTLNELNDDQLILVTDSYDVIMSANSEEIIRKYKKFNKKIVLQANLVVGLIEILHINFLRFKRRNLYLNSGGFIGDVASIKKIVSTVPSNSDDQRWYTQMFLSESGKEYMALDYNCEIFQCLNDAEKELEIHFAMSRLRNKINNTHPCQIHGNGGPSRKLKLNQYENYLIKNRTDTYGYNCKNDMEIKDKQSITVYIQFTNEKNNSNSLLIEKSKNFINQNIEELRSVIPNVDVIYSEANNLNDGLEEAYAFDSVDYYWLVDTDL